MSDKGNDIFGENELISISSDLRADGGHGNQESVSTLLDILSSRRRRNMLYYLRECEFAAVDELTRYVTAERLESPSETITDEQIDETTMKLIHTDLPKLREAGIVEYDPRSGTIRYNQPSKTLQILLRVLNGLEDPSTRSE